MDDLIEAHLAHCRDVEFRNHNTVADRRYVLERADSELPFGLVESSTEEIGHWLAQFRGATRYTWHGHIGAFFRWGLAAGYLRDDPTAALARPRKPRCVPRPVTDSQLLHILTHAQPPVRLWAYLAAYGGLRACEIARLRREEINEETTLIHGKNDKIRVVHTHPEIWASVRSLPCGPIARTIRTGAQATPEYVTLVAVKHFHNDLGVPTGLHRLRHWCLTNTLSRCKNLRVVQEIAGHESPVTTAVYTLVTSEERRAAIQALPTVAALS